MRMGRCFQAVMVCLALLCASAPCTGRAHAAVSVSGRVVDAAGPVAGAVVRQQATSISTHSAADGTFTLPGLEAWKPIIVTAWAEGYHPGGTRVVPPRHGVTITLKRHPAVDNPEHAWLTSYPAEDKPLGCGHCMVAYPQWVKNAHAGAARNPRFLSLYNGRTADGSEKIGGGYVDDFPGTAGNCANCHAPGQAANRPFTADMNTLGKVEEEGIFCDFCHKVAGVYLDPGTGLPYPNAPGVQSMRLNRPPADTHMFYGPFDDVTRRVSYLELEKKSEFCAPCHQFEFWGTPVYESFREWKESPYAARGIQCQGCHMRPTGVPYFVYPEKGGLIRDPELIASHLQPGAADETLLRQTVTLKAGMEEMGDFIQVRAAVKNTGAGHHVPTDFPGRHMILLVEVLDQAARRLSLRSGPVIADWGGAQAGLPGKIYAKLLRDVATGEMPVVSYWKQTLIAGDNRLAAMEEDVVNLLFAKPPGGGLVTLRVEVIFRRAFQSVMDARKWTTPDITMAETEHSLRVHPPYPEGVVPDVSANGSHEPVTVPADQPLSITVALRMETSSAVLESGPEPAEYWAGVYTGCAPPYDWLSYEDGSGWRLGLKPFRQAPLGPLAPLEILHAPLPPGEYHFFFAVDTEVDGRPQPRWLDLVQVRVPDPLWSRAGEDSCPEETARVLFLTVDEH